MLKTLKTFSTTPKYKIHWMMKMNCNFLRKHFCTYVTEYFLTLFDVLKLSCNLCVSHRVNTEMFLFIQMQKNNFCKSSLIILCIIHSLFFSSSLLILLMSYVLLHLSFDLPLLLAVYHYQHYSNVLSNHYVQK